MVTLLDKLKWKSYNKKLDKLLLYGAEKGLVKVYDEELIANLRHIYYGFLPASIIILSENIANGYCYDREPLITLGFGDDDFKIVDASIENLRLNPKYVEECKKDIMISDHCFAERKEKDGNIWVYDTSLGFAVEKSIYYKLENPIVRKENDRKTTLEYLYYDFLKDSNIEDSKYLLPTMMPLIEKNFEPIQPFYLEELKKEIEIFKKEIKYDEICEEVKKNIKR